MSIHVTVIGTVFVDCKGLAREQYWPDGRNLGTVQFVHGGVGRNVAENLAYLNTPVALVSTVDDSGLGHEIKERLKKNRVRTDFMLKVPERGMGMWLVIIDEKGNLAGSISHMPDLDRLQQWWSIKNREIIEQSSHIVLEIDLNETIAEQVLLTAKKATKPVYSLPGNMEIVAKRPDLLDQLSAFICNHHEAAQLWGEDSLETMEAEAILERLQTFLQTKQLQAMVVTLGARGAVYCDQWSGEAGYCPAEVVQPVDTSGAGDAFFSGTVAGLSRGLSLGEAVRIGTKTAAWTILSAESTNPELREHVQSDEAFHALRGPSAARS